MKEDLFRISKGAQRMTGELKEIGVVAEVAAFLLAATLGVAPVGAQQVTDVPGSPRATTMLDGSQPPLPPQKFGGLIEKTVNKMQALFVHEANK
jgi:hypothetical protein